MDLDFICFDLCLLGIVTLNNSLCSNRTTIFLSLHLLNVKIFFQRDLKHIVLSGLIPQYLK